MFIYTHTHTHIYIYMRQIYAQMSLELLSVNVKR